MVRGSYRTLVFLLTLTATYPAFAQDTSSGGPDSVTAGPYGVPRLVMNEGGSWEEPIKVFENEKAVTYVPDITSPGWAQWHVALFRSEGIYFTYLYIYWKDTRVTARVTLYVYTKADKVKVVFSFMGPIETFDVAKAPLPIARSIPKITAIVQDQSDRFQGQTIQEFARSQREIVARMALCSSSPDACPTTEPNGSGNSSKSGITPPVPIYTPEAKFSDEARRSKIGGVVLVSVVVSTDGNARDVKVVRSLGHGLDEIG